MENLKELVTKAETCFFCTETTTAGAPSAWPMSVHQTDDEGNLWFLSANGSRKNVELADDSAVTLYFQGSTHSDFLVFQGSASVSRDKQKIDELWEPVIKTWFTEGKGDPRITVIKVATCASRC